MPLEEPPRDAQGSVVPHNHHQISDEDGVLRRISPLHLVEDEKADGGKRVSSMAFQPSSGQNGGMSVDLERSIVEAGANPRTHVISPPFIGAVRFVAGQLRAEQFQVGYDPLPENPHHGEVWGSFSASKKKRLQALAEMYVKPK
ncbi:hypothetical protein GOC93_26045 [Sinorhizobium medicae]|uniref:hypothetical protein n=1 Tax=Sinorhizobium medicae TaxID=110321 RepID=UPI00129662D0|nr:hypothetical protein [Sinorhizobium medicae]MDX0617073.1 hypothetical protein [Sinorhizobium medicae]MDX1090359.1 hypothetical protein [Sinorhizobium medicae]MQW02040.1 hypothetical protein [Sinorhizobium medicae]